MYQQPPPSHLSKARKELPPIWRGIGFLLVLLLPVLAISAAVALFDYGLENGWPLYPPLTGYLRLPRWMWQIPYLTGLMRFLTRTPNLVGYAIFSSLMLLVSYSLLAMLYAFIYRNFGVERYLPVDVRQPRVKTRRYRR